MPPRFSFSHCAAVPGLPADLAEGHGAAVWLGGASDALLALASPGCRRENALSVLAALSQRLPDAKAALDAVGAEIAAARDSVRPVACAGLAAPSAHALAFRAAWHVLDAARRAADPVAAVRRETFSWEKIECEWQTVAQALRGVPALGEALAATLQLEIIRTNERRAEAATAPNTLAPNTPQHQHSADFRSVTWAGETYTFTATQAACVEALWQAWAHGCGSLSQVTILTQAGSTADKLRDVFNKGRHPAWGQMIVATTKGAFRLQDNPGPS